MRRKDCGGSSRMIRRNPCAASVKIRSSRSSCLTWFDLAQKTNTGIYGLSAADQLLKSGIVAQSLEINFDACASGVEIAAAFNRHPQVLEGALLFAHHGISAGDIIPRERIVGAFGQAFLEILRDVPEGFAGVLQVPLPHIGAR